MALPSAAVYLMYAVTNFNHSQTPFTTPQMDTDGDCQLDYNEFEVMVVALLESVTGRSAVWVSASTALR